MRAACVLIVLLYFFGQVHAQEFHVVFLNKKEDKAPLPEAEVNKLMEGHLANINRLADEGKLWAAGPFDGGGGIFIFKSSSLADVQAWLATDPAVAAQRWNLEVFPYIPQSGSVCQVTEPYEMTNYFFVRYTEAKAKSGLAIQHQQHLAKKRESVVTEASLGENNGSILVLKEEPTMDWLSQDPAVKGGHLLPNLKKLYIARGSFCESK